MSPTITTTPNDTHILITIVPTPCSGPITLTPSQIQTGTTYRMTATFRNNDSVTFLMPSIYAPWVSKMKRVERAGERGVELRFERVGGSSNSQASSTSTSISPARAPATVPTTSNTSNSHTGNGGNGSRRRLSPRRGPHDYLNEISMLPVPEVVITSEMRRMLQADLETSAHVVLVDDDDDLLDS